MRKAKNLFPKLEELNPINLIGGRTEIEEPKPSGKFNHERSNPRTLLITVSSDFEASLTISKSHQCRNQLKKSVYTLPALSKEDAEKENALLMRRQELVKQGVPPETLEDHDGHNDY